ncbi:Wadjet anti-phage system protein JetD domain-containing protein [Halomonas organivorans]|uniref:Wadjet protein JetD C-terminal domain-containing protein n=1 Tax=Halomonas organivorans TaxID=257772 RepID=A0A7W5BWS8_9GAMM|nr:Wadjet anti-phage system protein JetD domain-containing protein [Halomonas organivorans]MBB3140576.1 hypothetical protein [Halomonas organivorans]
MSELEQSARAAQAWLEDEWCRLFRRSRKAKRWNSASLVRRWKQTGVCDSEFIAWKALADLARQGVVDAPPGSLESQVPLQLGLSEKAAHRLRQTMAAPNACLDLTADQATSWSRALERGLDEWSLADQCRLAEGLRRLAADLPSAYLLTPFQASARYLLGSSKLLETLPRELVRAFGIDPKAFLAAPTWLLAEVPEMPEGLLLIENPQSFEQAQRLGLGKRLALVCAFGYGLSLGEAIRDNGRVRLVGEGAPCHGLARLLRLPRLTYWGDLDAEGLRIFLRLKSQLPGLRLSALMAPLADALRQGSGHPLHRLTGKEGQRAARLPRGMDQEWLEDKQVLALAGLPLSTELEARWIAKVEDG